MILKESLLLLAIGIALGVPATLAASRTVQSGLFGLSSSDPLTLIVAILIIAAVTLIAAWFPARRAAGVDPMSPSATNDGPSSTSDGTVKHRSKHCWHSCSRAPA